MEFTYYILLVYVTAVMGNPCFNQTLNAMPYPYNCNTFIVCWMSRPYFQACPIGSLFDTVTYNCQPWPIAMCCNQANPTLRRPLPPSLSSQPGGIIVKRILPPVSENLITKLLPDDITTQVTKLPVQQTKTEQQLLTKLTTISESSPFNEITTTRIKEPTFTTTKPFLTFRTSPDATFNIPSTNEVLLTSRSSLVAETITTLFLTTSLPQEDLSKNTIGEIRTESTTKQACLELLPTVTTSFTKAPELTTLITDSTRTKPQISTEHIAAEETTSTDLANTKIEAEIPITPSESSIIFTEKTTKLTSLSDTLQPIKITTLIHESEPTTILPQSSSISLKTIETSEINKNVIETAKVTSEPKLIITEPEITHITNIITMKPLPSITDTIKNQSNEEGIDNSNASTITAPSITTQDVSGTTSKANAITHVLSTISTEASLTTVPEKKTIPDSETAIISHSTTIDINTIGTELNGKIEPSITEPPSLSNTTVDNLHSTITSTIFRKTNDQNVITFTLPTYIIDVSPSGTAKNMSEKATEINSKITESAPESSLDSMASATTLLSISTSSSDGLTIIPYNTLPTKSSESDIHSTGTDQNFITNLETVTTRNPLVTKSKTILPLTISTSIPGSTQPSEQNLIITLATNEVSVITSEQNVHSTTSKITSKTEINSTQSEPNTNTGRTATITPSKATLPPIIPTSASNETTARTREISVVTTTPKVTSITEINSKGSEPNTITGTMETTIASKVTLPPVISTSASNGATVIISETLVESITSEVTSINEIYSTGSGPNTITDTMATITASKATVPRIIPTSPANGATVITSETSIVPTTPKDTSIAEINTTGSEPNTITNTMATNTASKATLPPIIPTSASNGATVTTSQTLKISPTSKITSITEINSIDSEPNAIMGTMATITASKATLPPKIPTSVSKEATVITIASSVESTSAKDTSITEINSTVSEPHTITNTMATITSSKVTLPPIIPTLALNGATTTTSQTLEISPTSKVKRITEMNSTDSEPNTITGTLATITTSKATLPPIIPTSASNEATVITSETLVVSTTPKVISITEITAIGSGLNTTTGTMATFTASKTTLPPIKPTLASNGATPTTSETSLITTTPKLTSITEINTTGNELNTITGTMATITASKGTLPPIKLTSASNEASPTTNETSVVSTTPKVISITEIISTGSGPNTATGMISTITSSKATLSPTISTSASNGASDNTSEISVEATPCKVTSEIEINSIDSEPITTNGTPSTIVTSKRTLPPIIPTSASKGATVITSDSSVESTSAKVTSKTQINSIDSETNIVLSTLATITASKATLPPTIRTAATKGANSINNNTSLEVSTLKDENSIENYIITGPGKVVTEYALRPDARKTTLFYLPPAITTLTTEEPCSVCSTNPSNEYPEVTVAKGDSATEANEKYSESTTSSLIETSKDITPSTPINTNISTLSPAVITSESSTNIRTISPISTTTTNPIITSLTSRRHLSPVTLKVTSPSAMTDNYPTVSVTKRLLPPMTMTTENPDIQSSTSRESTITTEIYTSGSERNPVLIDLNTPIRVSPSTSTKILTSRQPLPPVSVATKSHTNEPDIISTHRPLPPLTLTTSINASESIQNTEIMKQENTSLYTKRTLRPIPVTHNRPCPYYTSSTTSTISEAPLEPQLPECGINDNFVYPELVNCNYYFNCFNGIMQRLNCRPNFGFNPHTMKCVPVENAKCGQYKSAADQRSYLISFLLLNELTKKTPLELTKDKVEN